jgi:hypothetical protein
LNWYNDKWLRAEVEDIFARHQGYSLKLDNPRDGRVWHNLGDHGYQKQRMVSGPAVSDEYEDYFD